VIDAQMMEIPNPEGVPAPLGRRLEDAFARMSRRKVGRLVEEQLMDCHTPERAQRLAAGPLVLSHELQQPDRRELDDAVFELLGVSDPKERDELIGRLYEATARYFRDIRVVEIEKMQQRAKSEGRRFNVHDLAADIWDAAELEDATPLTEWIARQPESNSLAIILDEQPAVVSDDVMFSPNTVYFGKRRKSHVDCQSRGQAELVARLANLGIAGEVQLPADFGPCIKVMERLNRRVEDAARRFKELAESRTGDERVQQQLVEVLERWFVLGRETSKAGLAGELPEESNDAAAESVSDP